MKTSKILERYGYTDLYYEPDRIDYPKWAGIKVLQSILDELTSHYMDWETEAYRGHHGNEEYVVFVLDLGDSPYGFNWKNQERYILQHPYLSIFLE